MKKTILECPYCKSDITEENQICPKCGADCKEIIKQYRKEKEEEKEEIQKANREQTIKIQKNISRGFKLVFIPFILFFLIIFGFITYQILNSSGIFVSKKKDITGSLNETIQKETFSLSIDKYEVYEYYDDFFKDKCNTKKDYKKVFKRNPNKKRSIHFKQFYQIIEKKQTSTQLHLPIVQKDYKKVAFHIIIENLESQPKEVSDLIKKVNLKAGDENLEEVETNTDENFCKVVQGKASYNSIAKYTSILPNDKTSGYIGFEVPENEENLKFIINDSEIIEIKNPVFKEN